MLSRLFSPGRLFAGFQQKLVPISKASALRINQSNVITKRWSGHNAMDIEPSSFEKHYIKNTFHFWAVLSAIPFIIITTIANIRMNPELQEIPEGYEPRHWEYYRHPITRFMVQYLSEPMELEEEMTLHGLEDLSQIKILDKVEKDVTDVMKFYSDHRSNYFKAKYADLVRQGRDYSMAGIGNTQSASNDMIDLAHDPHYTVVPVEGYKPKD